MAWQIKDEWIDLALGHHKVVFHNPEVLVPGPVTDQRHPPKMVPVEHHLTHDFKLAGCPHCGHVKQNAAEAIDFHQVKKDMHERLHAHHKQLMDYQAKHPHVRIGHGPK